MMPTAAEQFYLHWKQISADIWPDKTALVEASRRAISWTTEIGYFVPRVIAAYFGNGTEIRSEFRKMDFVAWRSSNSRLHKPQYNQPLNVELVLEHENFGNPEEEFWKLLHFHCPLKILVFYQWKYGTTQQAILEFAAVYREFDAFHSRPLNEEYLFIVGDPNAPDFWRGTSFCGNPRVLTDLSRATGR